jgi:hypothetical protein
MALTTNMRRVSQWDGLMESKHLLEVEKALYIRLDRSLARITVGDTRELARVMPDQCMGMTGSLCCMQEKGG